MKNIHLLLLSLLCYTGFAQNAIPVSSLPGVEAVGQNDLVPLIQNGRYHKAMVWQYLAALRGTAGSIPYFSSTGALTSDSSFQHDSATGVTSISSTLSNGRLTLFQSGNMSDTVLGTLLLISDTPALKSNKMALLAVADLSSIGGDSFTVYIHSGNSNNGGNSIILQRSQGIDINSIDSLNRFGTMAHLQNNKMELGYIDSSGGNNIQIDSNGLQISYHNNFSYRFPKRGGTAGQALVSDSWGNLNWQYVGFPHAIVTPDSANVVSLKNNNLNIVNMSGDMPTLILRFPSSPADNSTVAVKFNHSAAIMGIENATTNCNPGSINASGGNPCPMFQFTYDATTGKWY